MGKPDDSPPGLIPLHIPRTTGTGPDHDEFEQAPPSYVIQGQVILISLLACFAISLLLFIIYGYLRLRQRRRRLAQWRQARLFFSNRTEPNPRCLDQNIIKSIPVIELSIDRDDKVSELCAVCISEFTDGEKLRALPQCGHRFHLECIDMWFASHSTCPLCRADVNSSSPISDQPVQLGETENKELCSVHRSPLDSMV
ncbi:RING-H2 finger protein ATL2-like [Carex rostrata]